MPHTYCSSLFHCVFSTKQRQKSINDNFQPELWAYIGGIARAHDMKALAVGGTDDHAHILLSLPSTMAVSRAMQQIKAAASKWMHEQHHQRGFEWQEGYGAFSIGVTQIDTTVAYIGRQREHHRKVDYRAEFLAFLKKHHIEYDLRCIWD
jgi:REP element-mobilizing transposase RayT